MEEKENNDSAIGEKISKEIKKRISKSSKTNVAKKSALKLLWPYIIWALVIVLIIIIVVGIVIFLITMPGMVMKKLKSLSMKIGNEITAFLGADTTKQIDKQKIYDVLDYLEEMGYDLKGYGFLTEYIGESDDGVERNDENKIEKAQSDFISAYLASDNYIYTVANKNKTNGLISNGNRITGFLLYTLQSVLDISTDGQLGQYWGKGMISIYHENGFGKPGTYYGGLDDWLGWSDVKVKIDEEKDKKILEIKRGPSDYKEFNLDGWTGRYGMPLDFLLSIHLATLMPDLAYDMIENFDTQIVMLLRNSGSVLEGTSSYDPYIAYVKNHWYRDVYFVQSDKEFVEYDYEYEQIVKERWTLYETYEDGEYKLYELDENGEYKKSGEEYVLFSGTQEDAKNQGINVSKKAKTLKYNEKEFEDLNWNKENGLWTAYDIKNDDVVQTGEGLRTETNPKIKKMFLENTYFRYDGTKETAEVITALRDENNLKYGPIEKKDFEKYVMYQGEKKVVSDYVGQVSLNQDSLNAFSMLENEHTLDSDFIYRDFKELIVELGYFSKEDLTEENPKLLQWIIPEIGSYQFPKRELDKKENEYGVLAHSKYDYSENDLNYNIDDEPEYEEGGSEDDTFDIADDPLAVKGENKKLATSSDVLKGKTGIEFEEYQTSNIKQDVGKAEKGYVSKDYEESGWEATGEFVRENATKFNINTIGKYYSKNNEAEYESFLQGLGGIFAKYGGKDKKGDGTGDALIDAAEYVYGLMGLMGFNYCAYCGNPDYDFGRCTPFLNGAQGKEYDAYPDLFGLGGYGRHTNGHGKLRRQIDDCMLNYNFVTCCNFTVDKVLYKAGLMGGEGQPRSSVDVVSLVEKHGGEPVFNISDLHLGDIINCYSSTNGQSPDPHDWTGYYHTMYIGEETDETITVYKTGHDYTNSGTWRREVPKDAPREALKAGDWAGVHLWDLEYNGNRYKGYKGNEAVVSPVTGILLEYDTYDEGDIDSITGEAYRTNVDLKYGTESLTEKFNTESSDAHEEVGKIVTDKVGYAKILVLDKESYLKLEKATKNKWQNDSLMTENGGLRNILKKKKDYEKWSALDKSIYGYKEFLKEYEAGGISGYIIYIDGFKCNLPGKLQDKEVKDDKPLSLEYFKGATSNKLDNLKIDSLYEKDEEHNFASQKTEEEYKAKIDIKEEASPTLYDPTNDIILIKEGTVIGRTLTDKELLESPEFRNKQYGTYEQLRENENSKEHNVIGNYIRIIMRDTDGTVVENVEDYMKLDGKYNNQNKASQNIKIGDDYDVKDESLFVTDEQFRKMFKEYPNILENTKAFIGIQDKYKVNAVFAACVTIVESSGGTAWDAIDSSTYNWFSIKGDYKGKSIGDWRAYPSFSEAVYDFGDLIANGSYYYKQGKQKVSQIGPTYCNAEWSKSVIDFMTENYKKII